MRGQVTICDVSYILGSETVKTDQSEIERTKCTNSGVFISSYAERRIKNTDIFNGVEPVIFLAFDASSVAAKFVAIEFIDETC